MGSMAFFDAAIEKKLMDLHCGYIGRVLSTDGITAKVQPLGLIKNYGDSGTKSQAVVDNVPVLCRWKVKKKTIYYADTSGTSHKQDILEPKQIEAGDLVACMCCDRDISAARRGNNVLPPAGRHNISDSLIVGIIQEG